MSEQAVCPQNVVVSQLIKAETKVAVEPTICSGVPKVYCLESRIKPSRDCDGKQGPFPFTVGDSARHSGKCSFILTQLLCFEVPIEFGIDVDIEKGAVRCSRPCIGPCPQTPCPSSILDEDEP